MAGKGKLVAGIVFLVLAVVFLMGAAWTTYTYVDGLSVQENNRAARDLLKKTGQDTSEIDKVIEENEALFETKRTGMAICYPLGIVFLVLGIALVLMWRRDSRMAPQSQLPAQQAMYGQYPYPPSPPGDQQYPPPPPGA